MSFFNQYDSNGFYRALAAVAITGPILLVLAADTLPQGVERGDLMVYGHGVVLAILGAALVLRAAYSLGFRKAFEIVASRRHYSVTA
jgi:threonine/homoserine/homoserine lactone efflux protein